MPTASITAWVASTCACTRPRPRCAATAPDRKRCRPAIKPVFSDGHDSGIYSWEYLHELCREQHKRWADYLARLALAGASREPAGPVLIARQ